MKEKRWFSLGMLMFFAAYLIMDYVVLCMLKNRGLFLWGAAVLSYCVVGYVVQEVEKEERCCSVLCDASQLRPSVMLGCHYHLKPFRERVIIAVSWPLWALDGLVAEMRTNRRVRGKK